MPLQVLLIEDGSVILSDKVSIYIKPMWDFLPPLSCFIPSVLDYIINLFTPIPTAKERHSDTWNVFGTNSQTSVLQKSPTLKVKSGDRKWIDTEIKSV